MQNICKKCHRGKYKNWIFGTTFGKLNVQMQVFIPTYKKKLVLIRPFIQQNLQKVCKFFFYAYALETKYIFKCIGGKQ